MSYLAFFFYDSKYIIISTSFYDYEINLNKMM